MKENSLIIEKSFQFAGDIYCLCKELQKKREFIIADQLLRSGTSIGANVEEGFGGHSLKEFAARYSIAYKESRETSYWLRLILELQIMPQEDVQQLIYECNELVRMLGCAQRTLRAKLGTSCTTKLPRPLTL